MKLITRLDKKGTREMTITVKQYLEIFKFSSHDGLKHMKRVLFMSHGTEDLKNRYDAVKITLGEV
jgi:hypothetical protein